MHDSDPPDPGIAEDPFEGSGEPAGHGLAERLAVIRWIRQMVEFWRITPAELDAPAAPAALPPPGPLPPKYRHPLTGDTWDGQGEHPEWLRRALLNDGYTVAELRVASTH